MRKTKENKTMQSKAKSNCFLGYVHPVYNLFSVSAWTVTLFLIKLQLWVFCENIKIYGKISLSPRRLVVLKCLHIQDCADPQSLAYSLSNAF